MCIRDRYMGYLYDQIQEEDFMKKKILIVGGVAGGASAATRLRRNSEEDQIIMFEKGPHVSFSNCALPYHLSGVIESPDKLVLMNPKKFIAQFNICLLYTSPSPRDLSTSRMPSSA
eukprot:TRINITY_DN15683_c0_g1_i1.p1 TRINITY_DN15683_c0_g1~~TRINITY_DN15683_c0_g1_i1.p1  ORF type:complete len:116 (-),score=16.58 TRINITY_DN15683_c0_g1_i1:69-416(-)